MSPPPRGGQFPTTIVHLSIDLVLPAAASLRCASAALALLGQRLGLPSSFPCFSSIRNWLLRLGCYALRRALPVRPDWVWLVDPTIQIGNVKLLIILGVPLAAVAFSRRCLRLADLHLLALVPREHSNGDSVARELSEATKRAGVPRLIVSDHGTDLKAGIGKSQQGHAHTAHVYDVAHQGALVLQRRWEEDPRWGAFFAQLGRTRAQVQQAELAALTAPAVRRQARFLNVGPILRFAQRVLRLLEGGEEELREKVKQKYGWLKDYEQDVKQWQQQHEVVQRTVAFVRCHGLYRGAEEEVRRQWLDIDWTGGAEAVAEQMKQYVQEYGCLAGEGETLVGSTEVLESCIGKLKRLEAEQSGSGITGLALAVGAMVGSWTEAEVKQALEEVPQKEAETWVSRVFGKTVQWLRRHLFRQADEA